ncbi:MAG: hemin uptake protein HemP [Burkholderiaceae bacterium]|jgi:hemin uptake protein HemP
MQRVTPPEPQAAQVAVSADSAPDTTPLRIKSRDLFGQRREVEIDHDGRIYRLRLTQLNKLILTA